MSILDDVGDKLVADAIVSGATGWTLYKSYLPATPDKAIALFEAGGDAPDQTPGTAHDFPDFQVRGRSAEFTYDVLRTKMQEVFDSLNDATLSGYIYTFAVQSGPIPMGFDKQNNRPELVWNFRAMKER